MSFRQGFYTLSASAALVLSICATPSFAGEITGSGKRKDVNGRSECAYSGLNDEFVEGDLTAPRVQSYGQLVREGFIDPTADPRAISACNPNNLPFDPLDD